jgi:electron transfer flavoprotein alpha subunit
LANILVYIELVDDSASWASLLALRQARHLSTNVGATIYAVLPCASPPMYGENDIIALLSRQGADKVILMTHGDLSLPALFHSHGEALLTAANQFPPALLLVPDGPAAAEIAPRVSARLGGLFVRHPDISVQEGCNLRIDQPFFDDTHVRRFDSADLEHSVVAVVSPDPQQFSRPLGAEEAEVVVISPVFGGGTAPRTTLAKGGQGNGRPQRMVLVGAGITDAAELDAIRHLAELLKADLRVTEGAAKKGLLEAPTLVEVPLVCRQELVLAFGVHGSPETLGRLAETAYVVGVNPDERAPLFRRAQLGLVAPALETAQQMVADAKARPAEPLLPAPMDAALADTVEASRDPAAAAPSIRDVNQMTRTPPMGTPLTSELRAALAAAAAVPRAGASAEPPTPTDVSDDTTPEAKPAGVVTQAGDPALDDTVPAPLPGGDAPGGDAPGGDTPAGTGTTDNDEGEQEP